MRIELASANAKQVAERWRGQYERGGWTKCAGGDSQDVYKRLLACDDDPDKIAAIVGNKSWSYISCDDCRAYVRCAAVFGDYGETAKLCKPCLSVATAAITAVSDALSC